MFVLDETHHCKPKQQPLLGIWILLHVVSSERGFQAGQGRAAESPSIAGVAKRQPFCHLWQSSPPADTLAAAAVTRPCLSGPLHSGRNSCPAPGIETRAEALLGLYSGPASAGGRGASSKAQAAFLHRNKPRFLPPSPGPAAVPGRQSAVPGAGRYLPAAGR